MKLRAKLSLTPSNLKKILSKQFIEKSSGILPINFSYIKSKDNFKFEGIGETDELIIKSKFLGDDLNFSNGRLRILLSPFDKNISGFLDLKTKNLELEINSILSDLELQNLEILEFKSPLQDFSLSMKKADYVEININGNNASFPPIKLGEKSKLMDYDEIKFDLNLSEIFIGANKFNNPLVNFEKKDGKFVSFLAKLDGEKDYHKISLKDEVDKKKLLIESNFVPGLLKVFDMDLKINTGSLKIEGEKKNNSNVYEGKIAGKDFVFIDALF